MSGCVLDNSVAIRSLLDSLKESDQTFSRTLSLCRAYNLSSYDAAYLELAIREGLPLATLDGDLRKAAQRADVLLYLKHESVT